ncbi:MAG TPA: SpoIIE family protein phosphatase [Candidatus Acidoferrales bacterium]|nr:SpoIIE family protein phosphatase [Candidatus Acidoferrales bacterium]
MEKVETVALVDCGVAAQALPGQTEIGDRHAIVQFDGGAMVAVVDGLGHGPGAAAAARIATEVLEQNARESVLTLVRLCHEELKPTRGVVMSLASFKASDATVTWLGVGNVEGVLLHRDPYGTVGQEVLPLRGGVVGDQLPSLVASIVPVSRGDTLIFVTDGVRLGFADGLRPGSAQAIADTILARFARGTDDALVLVARYTGPQKEVPSGWAARGV